MKRPIRLRWALTDVTFPGHSGPRRIRAMKGIWKWVLAVALIASAVYGIRRFLDET